MNDRTDVDEIRRRLSIVEIVGEHVALKRAGSNFKGLCPFHTEKSPSFTVSDERGLYKCFGCGESGDIFSFVMKVSGVAFPEALKELARRAGVTLKRREKSETDSAGGPDRDVFYAMNRQALDFYRESLASEGGKDARAYLKKRGITPEMIDRFQLGYAPDDYTPVATALRAKFSQPLLEASGLLRQAKTGKWYDLFRDRIIFPIHDTSSRVVAFGARLYRDDPEAPKYINSPETPIYVKGRHCYAMNLAKDALRKETRVILVEGYTDVIIAHKHGFENVIAGLGTALTKEQLALIGRFTSEIVLAYDADSAGRKAAERGIDLALDKGLKVRVAAFPEGLDPADALERRGRETFAAAIAGARDFLEYRIDLALEKAETPIERARAAGEIVQSLSAIEDKLVRAAIVRRLADRFGVSETVLASAARPQRPESEREETDTIVKKMPAKLDSELSVLKLILEDEDILATARERLVPEDFSKEPRQAVFRALIEARAKGEPLAGNLNGRLEGLELDLLAHLATMSLVVQDKRRVLEDFIRTVRIRRIDDAISHCTVSLRKGALVEEEREDLTRQLSALMQEKRTVLSQRRGEAR